MKNLFVVENLCYAYLKRPLCIREANFSANKNDRILILGLDDKGKTTLIKAISAFDERYFGNVFYNGEELRKINPQDRLFSLIFDYSTLLNSTIDANLNYLYETIGVQIPSASEKNNLLAKFNLCYKLSDKVKVLTNFEKFKLCLLRVYIKKSRIVFIDDILKNGFTQNEVDELMGYFELISKDSILFFCANEKSFKQNINQIKIFTWSKVLYLNNTIVHEKQNLDEFTIDPIDLDVISFSNEFECVDAYCINQDGEYFISIDENIVIKIEKPLYANFDKLKLSNLETEDLILAYKKGMEFDYSKNNDINNAINKKELLIFSKIDRSRIN